MATHLEVERLLRKLHEYKTAWEQYVEAVDTKEISCPGLKANVEHIHGQLARMIEDTHE